jgi:hypothetical protein
MGHMNRYLLFSVILSLTTTTSTFAFSPFSNVIFATDTKAVLGEKFERKIFFDYASSTPIKASVNGNKAKTGIEFNSTYFSSSPNTYTTIMSGVPKEAGKYKLNFYLNNDNKKNVYIKPFEFEVKGVTFSTSTIPDLVGLRQPQKIRVYFNNPTKKRPLFSYNFPYQFGRVTTEAEEGPDYTTIMFNPGNTGNFKFTVTALNDQSLLLGKHTYTVKISDKKATTTKATTTKPVVKATTTKPVPSKTFSVTSSDWRKWLWGN